MLVLLIVRERKIRDQLCHLYWLNFLNCPIVAVPGPMLEHLLLH